PASPWCLTLGLVLMAFSLWSALFLGLTTVAPIPLGPWQRVQKVAVVALMHFVHPVVRSSGRIAARLRTGQPAHYLPGVRWLHPRRLLAEAHRLLQRPKQTRGYWGLTPERRAAFLRDVQGEVKQHRI